MAKAKRSRDSGATPDPDGFVGYTIARLAHALEQRMEEALAGEGLTVRQFGALAHLAREPGIGSGQLARLILITPQSMGALVQSLEQAGFVERDPSVPPGVRIPLRLTPRGGEALARAYRVAAMVDAETTSDLTAADRAALNAMLHRMLAQLTGGGASPGRGVGSRGEGDRAKD